MWFFNLFKKKCGPSIALSRNIYMSKELAGFSISRLDVNKSTIFTELITDRDAQKMLDFIKCKLS